MDLLKRARTKALQLRGQGLFDRVDRLVAAVKVLEARFQRPHEEPHSLAKLNLTLEELSPLPTKIWDLKRETLNLVAEALGLVLRKALPFILLLDDSETYYRKAITVLHKCEEVSIDGERTILLEFNLILYENGRLIRERRLSGTTRQGIRWDRSEEEELDCVQAISFFSLDAIALGLANALERLHSVRILHQDLEVRHQAITGTMGTMRCAP